MLEASAFVDAARSRGFGLWAGVPCSYLQPFINYVIGDAATTYVPASNEGDAVAIACGSELAGQPAVAMMQNSGLGNAVNPLTSLAHTHRIPLLLIVTLRGEPGGPADEPQHALMGAITTRMLELMDIPWAWFPTEPEAVAPCLDAAMAHLRGARRPYALVMRKGSVAAWPTPPAWPAAPAATVQADPPHRAQAPRAALLAAVLQATGPADAVVATTGFTGRELWALDDRPNQLYLVGAMGCAASVGLGIALAQPRRRVLVLDGDGALLMRLGALAAIGHTAPANLVHVLLDNGQHESTGGQATVSGSVHFAALAQACGYRHTAVVSEPSALAALLADPPAGPVFVRAMTVPGVPDGLPRPAVAPDVVAERLRRHLRGQPA